ncbi:hypothetical protein GCM10010172_04160 [Paractinoplanes ferrugineus]|uniref:Uncharacterized protein n=1 Tax=Paractinoplanes ferrugineus TaxID=113564 RepID=A0A919JAY4_9ACTN|nr:hypothetical protein [Actinoplanes ferrugineus]GIE13821.1 hypothetical protein Afe05nite_56610 [Actinoplanes ferrugineus]
MNVPDFAQGLDAPGWEKLLFNGADAQFTIEAPARLIARHGYWLQVPEFMEFVEFYPPDAAGIRFPEAAAALDAGRLPTRDQEDENVLRFAAGLAGEYRFLLTYAAENNSAEAIALMAEALMYRDGFTTSTATPRP